MWQAIAVVAVFIVLVAVGLLFVNHSVYKDFEGRDPVVQVRGSAISCRLKNQCKTSCVLNNCAVLQALFAIVFGLSVNLLLLILSEILGVLSHRSAEKWLTQLFLRTFDAKRATLTGACGTPGQG